MSEASDWLERRREEAPEALAGRMAAAVEAVAPAGLAVEEALAAAALAELKAALALGDARAAATPLLSADALLTYAFQAAAERGGPEAVLRLAAAYGPDRFEELRGAAA